MSMKKDSASMKQESVSMKESSVSMKQASVSRMVHRNLLDVDLELDGLLAVLSRLGAQECAQEAG